MSLYNRRFFEEELKRLDTERNLPVSILYADINGLKTINDVFGHKRGDKLIKMVSTSIKTSCRTDEIIARVGGDEFVILLPKTNVTAVEALAKRIALEVEKKEINDIKIFIAIGWDTRNCITEPILDVMQNAENKLIMSLPCMRDGMVAVILRAWRERRFPGNPE